MKCKKALLICVAVMALAIGMMPTYAQGYYDWDSTVCRYSFLTSGSQTKYELEEWSFFDIAAGGITYTPSLPADKVVKLQAAAHGISSSGSATKLGDKVDVTVKDDPYKMTSLPVYNMKNVQKFNEIKARIYNAYGSSYNMASYGSVYCV